MAATPDGGILVCGGTDDRAFTGAGAVRDFGSGGDDAFVLRIDAADDSVLWTTFLGDAGSDSATAVATDPSGAVVVLGKTDSGGIPGYHADDVFLARLEPDGSAVRSSLRFGGSRGEEPAGLSVAPDGTAWIAGTTSSDDLPTAGAVRPRPGAFTDAFVAAFAPGGDRPAFSTYLPGSLYDGAEGIVAAPDGSAWVAGSTQSADFPAVEPVHEPPVVNRAAWLAHLAFPDPALRPRTPASFNAEVAGPREVRLRWSLGGETGTGVSVYRLEGAGFARVAVLPAGAEEWTDDSALPGEDYLYAAQAFGEGGPSDPTPDVAASTPPTLDLRLLWPRSKEWFGLSGVPHLLVARLGPAAGSPREPPDPRETGLEIRFGEEATWPWSLTYRIPAGDPGWRGPANRLRWTDPNGAYNLRVVYNRRRGRILVRSESVSGSFLEGTPVRVRVTMGEDAGRDTIPWPRYRP